MSSDDEQFENLAKPAFGGTGYMSHGEAPHNLIETLIASFEGAGHSDDSGNEFWYARDLQFLLGYTKWDNFLTVIQRAREACVASGHTTSDHFAGVGKMINLGKGGIREIEDIVLSRYACYLIAQNGDPRKQEIALRRPILRFKPGVRKYATMKGLNIPHYRRMSAAAFCVMRLRSITKALQAWLITLACGTVWTSQYSKRMDIRGFMADWMLLASGAKKA